MPTLTHSVPSVDGRTPWGQAQTAEAIPGSGGCILVTTASHGGLWVPKYLRVLLPKGYRRWEWFEEDCEIAIPLLFLQVPPFPWYTRGPAEWEASLRGTLSHYYPTIDLPAIR